ncbi:unnamed protein product [Urochloa humidicola]
MRSPARATRATAANGGTSPSEAATGVVASNTRAGRARRFVAAAMDPPGGRGGGGASPAPVQAAPPIQRSNKSRSKPNLVN